MCTSEGAFEFNRSYKIIGADIRWHSYFKFTKSESWSVDESVGILIVCMHALARRRNVIF